MLSSPPIQSGLVFATRRFAPLFRHVGVLQEGKQLPAKLLARRGPGCCEALRALQAGGCRGSRGRRLWLGTEGQP